MGHEETFEHDLDDDEEILRELLALTGRVASRLRADGYRARTVTLKARLATFTTLTRSRTMADPTDVGADLYQTVAGLYRALPGERRRIRLLGVQATGLLSAGAEQLALLHGERWSDVERTIDRIEERFGRGAAQPASLWTVTGVTDSRTGAKVASRVEFSLHRALLIINSTTPDRPDQGAGEE